MVNPFSKNKQKAIDYKMVFLGSEAGRRVLADLYRRCGMNAQVFDPSSSEATAFNAGKHRVGQAIQSILSHSEQDVFDAVNQLAKTEASAAAYDVYNQNKESN